MDVCEKYIISSYVPGSSASFSLVPDEIDHGKAGLEMGQAGRLLDCLSIHTRESGTRADMFNCRS